MKFITLAMALSMSFGVFAGGKKGWDKKLDQMSFDDAKSMMQEHTQQRQEMLTEYTNCINNAKDKNALKDCKEDKRQGKQAMEEDLKDEFKQSQEDEKVEDVIE